jgi:hypothetical protein
LFPSLFAKSTQPCDFISNMGSWVNNMWL